jgi:5S rRNA maturation endonuclease (ribonuclease M5)
LAIIQINGRNIDVDIRAELEQFPWTNADWSRPDKLIAASPFRYDRKPSFYVYLENTPTAPAGSWGDSGAYDTEWAKGGFVKLLAFLRNETESETIEYLLNAYAFDDSGNLTLRPPKFRVERIRQPFDESKLAPFEFRYDYLLSRGISEHVQRQMGVRYSAREAAVVIPWRLPNGKLANMKFRKTRGKAFWYFNVEKTGWPIRELVYGIDVVYAQRAKRAVICEAEIDAMSVMECGVPAIAVGGSAFNRTKAEIILRSPIEELTVLTDNDKAGRKLREEIIRHLAGKIRLRNAFVDGCKDANELLVMRGKSALRKAVDESEGVRVTLQVRL